MSPRTALLARLLAVSSSALAACGGAISDTSEISNGNTGGTQSAAGQGGVGSSAGAAGAGAGGAAGCAGDPPLCMWECSDAWPDARCQGGQWVCPKEPPSSTCSPLGGTGGFVGGVGGAGGSTSTAGAGGAISSAGGASVGAGGGTNVAGTTGKAGAGGSEALPPCMQDPVGCSGPAICYTPAAMAACAQPSDPDFPAMLGCEPNPNWYYWEGPKPDGSCCYSLGCPGGRPLIISDDLVVATAAPRSDWG